MSTHLQDVTPPLELSVNKAAQPSASSSSSASSSLMKKFDIDDGNGDGNGDNNHGDVVSSSSSSPPTTASSWCNCCYFGGVAEARGYNVLASARGSVVMSNIFLASSLIYLACDAAGGLIIDENGDSTCEADLANPVHGMQPLSLITNIAVVSGLLSALFMPVIGAIIDFTPHRRLVGISSAMLLTAIHAAQIGTVESTWFAMAILQAIAGFIYQIQVVAVYSYLPEIARQVGQPVMNIFTSTFTMTQFASQATFNVAVIAVAVGANLSTVQTGMASQAICTIWCIIFFTAGWRWMPHRESKHSLEKGQSVLFAGFRQNYNTAIAIHRRYRKGLKWFFLALIFAEASAAAITSVSVVYLNDTIGLNTLQVGIFFLVALVSSIPGAKFGSIMTNYLQNPNSSIKLCQLGLIITLAIGAFALEDLAMKELSYIWAAVVGALLGWFYPTENLFFSMCLPRGQEAELAGFFVYCTQILGWLPPLLFSILIENNVAQKYGVILSSFGFVVSIGFLSCAAPWPEIVQEAEEGGSCCDNPVIPTTNAADDDDSGAHYASFHGGDPMTDDKESTTLENTDATINTL